MSGGDHSGWRDSFFEKPRQLRSKHPELYLQLQQLYSQDPAALGTR